MYPGYKLSVITNILNVLLFIIILSLRVGLK